MPAIKQLNDCVKLAVRTQLSSRDVHMLFKYVQQRSINNNNINIILG